MLPWWFFVIAFFVLPAAERIKRNRYLLLTAGQGALPVAVTTAVGWTVTYLSQAAAYAVSFVLCFAFVRPRFIRKHTTFAVDNESKLIGRELEAEGTIEPTEQGSATLAGRSFAVKNVGDATLAEGARCVARDIEDYVLLVSSPD